MTKVSFITNPFVTKLLFVTSFELLKSRTNFCETVLRLLSSMNAGRGLISELSDPRVHTESSVMTSPNIFVSLAYFNTLQYFRKYLEVFQEVCKK